jgi:protease II
MVGIMHLAKVPGKRRMRDDTRNNREVLGYIEEENQYARAYFDSMNGTVDTLLEEMDSRLPTSEVRHFHKKGRFVYYEKRERGDQYWNVYRNANAAGGLGVAMSLNIVQHEGQGV